MIKKIIVVLMFSVLISSVYAQDLEEYPDMFKRGSNLDVITIVGDKAPATHVLAQTQIALALSNEVGKQVPGLTRLSSEVDRIDQINVISIGNACDNPTSAEILGNPSPCDSDLERGVAHLELYENENGKMHLVLNAYGDAGIRKLGDVLVNYEDFPLNGDSLRITVDGEDERSFDEDDVEDEKPVPVLINEEADEKQEEVEPVLINEEEAEEEEESTIGSGETVNLGDEEPEPVLPEEKNFVLRIINWFKGLFG